MTTASQLISKVGLDTSDLLPQTQAAQAAIGQGIAAAAEQGQAGINRLGGSFDVLSQAENHAEQNAIRTAQAHARAMVAEGDRAGAIRVLSQAQNDARGISEQTTYQIQTQIANLESGASAAQQYGAAFSQGLLNIVGPAAVATAAIGAVVSVANSFKEAFTFGAELDANTKAIEIQLTGVRESGVAFQQAQHYADVYKLTQQQTTEAMIASIPVIRQSTSSMEEILGVFDRLQLRQPGKTFQDAARAIGELQAGQYTSLNRIFNVPLEDAHKLSLEIKAGGDAVQLVSQYLSESGLGMDALKAKTEGAAGALRDYAKAQEALTIQQGEFAKGPGINLLGAATVALGDATKALGGGGDILSNNLALLQANVVAATTYGLEFAKTGNLEASIAAAAAARGEVYRKATGATRDDTDARREAIQSYHDATNGIIATGKAAKEVSEQDLAKLETAATRASDAYAKLTQAATDYATKGQEAAAAHNEKLASLAEANVLRLTTIDRTEAEGRAKATDDWRDRVTRTTADGNRRLLELEDAYNDDLLKRRAQASDRYFQIGADLALKVLDDRRNSAQRIAEIVATEEADSEAQAQAAADRQVALSEQLATAEQDSAKKLAAFEQTTYEQRSAAQATYEQKVVDLAQRASDLVSAAQESASRRQTDAARTMQRGMEDAADRASDLAVDRQNAEADRAQAHADKLAAIQAQAAGGGAGGGRITTLTGGRFTTEDVAGASGSGASVAAQIASENARYAAQLAATERSQFLTDSRAARDAEKQRSRAEEDRNRAEQDAAEKLADQQRQLAVAAAVLDRDYASQVAKAEAAADKQRGILVQAEADKLAAIELAAAKQEAAAAKADAASDARANAAIAKERQAEAIRESDAVAAADRARQALIASTNAELQARQQGYDDARLKQQEAIARQIQDENTAYGKRVVEIAKQASAARAAQEATYADQVAQEQAAYAKAEIARGVAYAKQKTQLETALGEQETAYVKAQEQIGLITRQAADARLQIIAASYGRQADAQRAAFNAAFGDLTKPNPTQTITDYLGPSSGTFAPASSSITIAPGAISVAGVSDPAAAAAAVRDQFIRLIRAAGGNVSQFFGGP